MPGFVVHAVLGDAADNGFRNVLACCPVWMLRLQLIDCCGGGGGASEFVAEFHAVEAVTVNGGHVVVVADVLIMQVHLVLFAL
ncbi:Uncharacterised protein [Mycobacteroides abscessus subsp. massiliense]|nr:Uncharacterised protein [Mycobacteroides abscessus subsp. massiliense]